MQSLEEINIYNNIIKDSLCHNEKRWIGFLKSSAYLYKYPFENQISIYGSSHKARMDSDGIMLANLTACATAEQWNRLGASINENAKGISIIKDGKPTEVYDISDTNSATKIWQTYDSPDFYSILARRTRTSAVDLKGAIDECISRFVDNESINFSSEWTNGRNFQINSIKLIVYTRCGIDTNSIDLSHMNFNSVFGNDSLGIDYANKYVVSPAGDILRAIERSVREYENSERNKAKTAEQSIEEDVLPQEQPPVKEAQIRPNPEQKISEQSQTAQQQRKNNIIGNTAYRNIRNKIYRRMAADVGERLSAELDSTEIKYSGKINNDNTITFTFGGADIESVNNIIFKVNGNTREKKEAEKTLKQQSKPKHRSFTYEELNIARNTDLVDFLSRQGEELKKVGQSEYTMKAHDSMRINGNKYYWNSRSFGGNALDFCMKYYGMSFQDSVAQLLAYNGYSLSEDLQTQPLPKPKEQPKAEKEEKKTEHPEPIPNPVDTKTNRVYAYLTKTRGISPDIVNKLINDGLVVQDVKGNAVFKIFDDKGELSGAEINGTTTGRRFKELTEWKGNTFVINPTGGKPEKAIFVESAIDAVSFHNLNREDTSLIVSMAGLKHQAVLNTMNRYGLTAENCLIASDNDEKGIEFMKKMKNEYNINSYPIVDDWHYAAHNINGENIKDWNELLIAERNIVAEYINDYLNSSEIFTPNIEYSKLLNISAEFYDYDESEHNVDSKAAELVNRYRNGENIFVELGKYLGYDSKIDTRLGSVNMSVKESEEGVTFSYGSTERFLSWEDFGKGQMDYLKNYFIDYLQDLYNKETMPVINDYGVDLNDWENSEESIREVERLENLLSRLGGKEIVLNPEGAFYEIYGENAKTAADILGLNLTYKNIDGVKTPIVGFPYFALDRNVKKLSVNGYTVNINENTAQIEQTKNDNVMSENMPDNSISIDDRNNYGYTSDELLPLNRDKALELFDSGISVYLLYNDNSEALAESREDIEKFDGIFGIEADEWENVLRNEQNIANEVSVDKLSLPFAVGDSIVYANGDKEHLWTVTNIDAESNRVTLSRETGGIVISQETVNKYIDEVVEYFNIHNAEFIALKAALENHEPVYLVSRGEIFHNPRIEYTDSEKFRIASDVEYGGLPAIHAIRLGNMDVISLIKYIKDEGYVVDYSRLGLEKATQIEQKKEIELSENNDTFEYQGYHFRPVGTFLEKDDFNSLSRNINSHSSPYMSVYDDSEIPYSHGEFYSASNNSTADIFLCIETGKVFAPGENELFEFTGEYEPYLSAEKELTVNENIAQNEQEKETTAVENETFIPEYIYKMEANPQTTGREDLYFIQSYLSKENGKADIGDILYMGTPEKCQDIMEQLKAGNITQEEVKELYAKEQSEQSPIITEQINSPTQKATSYEENKAQDKELTELQKKSLEIFEKYRNLPLQNKVGIIAQAFGCKTGEISTTPCGGKWRGTSDVHIRFDNGVSLFIGNSQTSKAKTAGVQTEFVDSALKEYNPEIIKAAKEAALPLLLQRETKDNAIATEKDLKPYTLLNVEFNDGRNNKSDGNLGWYYVTLAVDNRICTHIETGLNHDISDGKISSVPKQSDYFTAGGLGGLRDKDADYVFNNVGFSSLSDSYSLPLRDDVRERAEKTLAERRAAESTQQKQESKRKTGVIGNTAYKYISKKIYRKFDNETAEKIASAFNEAGFKYSGIVRDRETTFTFSGNDLEQVQAVIDRITKDIANKKEQPQAVETSFAEQTDGILNSTANGNVVQENQEKTLENSKKTNTNGVIGNINFKYISKKTYRKFDNETAEKIASAFDETGLKYSGKVGEKTTTLTFSGNDLERAQAVIDRITKAEPGKENNAQNEQNILYDDLEKSSENTILRPLNHKEIEDYISIKEEFSDSLVGYELDGYFQFYGKDAQRVSGILKRKEFERQIENNVTSMTAIPAGKYISSGSRWYFPYIKEIWSRGENIYLAEKNKDGSHQLMQYFRSEDYLPLNTIVNIDGRKYNIENVDFSKGMVTLRDIAKVNNNQPLFINEPVDYVRSYYEEEEHEENTFNYRKNITQNKQNISSENSEKSSIHFGLLGNGITAFDTSKEKDGDYLTVAHISNEGVVNFYVNDLKESDKELIQEEADRQKVLFTEDWNKLSNEIKYERILSTANASQLLQISNDKISLEDAVKKYEHSIIFKDEAFPTDINKTAVAGLTKDDIDSVFLKADEPTKDIKYRVYRQFNSLQYRVNRNKRSKSNIDFLKNEYGTYSAAHDFPDGTKGNIYFNNKEMSIVKQGTFSDPDIIFRWADVESRINTLVRENRYFNDEEKEYYPKYLESIKAPQYEIDNYMKDVRRKFIADNSALPPSEKRDSLALRLSDFIRDLDNYERNLLENVGRTDLANISADEMEKHLGEPETVQQLIDFLNDVQWKTPDVYSRGNSWHFRQELAELYPMRYICNLYDVVYIDSSKFEVLEAADDNFVLRNVDMPLDTRFLSLEELQEQLSKSTANDKYKRIVIEEPSHNQQINIDSAPNSKQTQDKAVNTNINASSMLNQSFSQDIIDLFLINGSNTDNGRMMIATELMKQKPIEEIAESLKTIYHGGFGIQAENKTVSAWYADDGIHLSSGRTARYDNNAQIISWGEAAERIGQLLLEGKFATNVELAEADSFEIEQIARKIIDLYRDLSDEGKNQNLLPSVSSILSNSIGYPDMVKTLAEKLNVNDSDLDSDLNFRKLLYADFTAFKNVYKQNRSVLRFHYHNIDDIDRSVRELELPRFKSYKANMSAVPSIKMFITDDEINADFTRGSGVSGGKIRIYNYFSETHTSKERADFLKNEYGTGGHSPAFSGAVGSSEWHDSKGMRYSKNNCEDVKFNWSQAVKRIEELIENGRYLTEKEKNQVNEITNEEPVPATEQSVNNEFMNDSDKEEIHNENLENKEENITYVPLYKNTPSYAHEHNELDLFRASNRENRRCRAYIEKTISENFDGMYLDPTVIDDAIEQFGVDRVSYVLAATVKAKDYDERFSSSNRKWADTVDISFRSPNSFSEIINSHSAILDGFINLFRKELERELVIEQEQAVDENSINKNEYSLMSNENEISFTEPVADFVENISLEFTGNISDIQQMKDFILSLGRTVHTYSDTRIEVFADSNIKNELSVKADELNVSVNELPTITCEFSESGAFENGRVYSVAEFDKLMREADKKFAEGKNEAIQFYGSVEAWNEAAANNNSDNKFTEFIGYDKVEFTVNMPDGSKITERQDIGDGYGGVIDYLKHFEKSSVIEILEAAVTGGINQADLGKENSAQLKQDNTDLDNDIIEFAAKYDDIYKDLYDNYDTPEKMDSIKNEYNAALKAYDEVAANDPNNYHSKYVSYREDEFTSDRELAAFVFAVCGGIEQFKDTSYYKNYISLQNALENHETIYFNESADETIPASWENAYGNKRLVYDNYSDNGIGYELIADMIIEPKVDGLILYALKDTYSIDDVRDFIESFNLSVDYSRLENAAQLEQDKTEKIEPAFNENTIYDVLLAVRDQHNFEFGNAEVIDDKIVNDKCKMLAENIKGIIDEKSLYPDWFNNQNIRSQLGIDIKINLIKNGYPAQHSTEVFNKIMEQIDIGGFEKNSNKSDLDIGINQTDLKKENFIQVDQDNSAQIEHSYNVNISKTKLDNGTKNVDKSYILQNALENYKDVYFKETGNEIIYDWVRKYFGEKGLHISPDEDYDSKYEFMLIGNDDTLEEFKNIDEVKQYIINHNLSVDFDRLETTVTKPENFRITDYDFISGNAKERFRDNINAIKTLFTIESEGRQATPKEQEILAKYVGWGGLALAFDEREDAWVNEYKELKELLPEDLYKSARSTVNDSFYTPPVVINATYKAIENMGFKEGKILEPSMGVGNFFGMLPENLNGSKLYGVEIDDLSGRIAKQLYPNAHIQIKGFEKTAFASNSFDVAIGNVPFGTQYINDKDFKGSNLIHDYFFKKALDKVRPGGVVAFITSIGTLDKKDSSVRKYLAERADLLGALRLPDNTFKKNAGTDVASDIIFLQKRETPRNLEKDGIPDWVNLSQNQDNITMNSYFINNPEMVLGEMKEVSGRFGPTTVCRPFENADLAELLEKAVSNIKGSIEPYEIEKDSLPPEIKSEVDPEGHRNFCYDVIDGDVYYRENDIMTKTDFNKIRYKDAPERMKGMIEISHCVQELIRLQLENYSPEAISRQQDILNVLYDSFTEKYGLLSDRVNSLLFKEDDTSPLLQSLENINEKGEFISKADIFSKRTIIPHVNIASVDTASEALAVSISEKAKVDLDFMAELCSKNKEDIIEELEGIIFENPLTKQYETADEYLSGNVREKLNTAREFAATDSKYKSNVTALEQAQPADLEPSEISVQLGSTWIPAKYYEQFMYELLQTPKKCRSEEITNTSYRHIRNPFVCSGCNCDNTIIAIDYDNHSASFAVSNKKSYFADSNNVLACKTFGTGRRNAYEIIEASLNLKTVQIFDTFTDELGKKHQVLNEKETLLAQEKQNIIKNKFKEWIFDDAERTAELCELYNKKFNSTRPREYDGSHINFVGMNPEIELREHQQNAIAHTLYGGNTLLAHSVGAGKSATRS